MKYKAFDNKNKRWLSGFLINSDGKVLIRGQDFSVELKEIDATLCRGTGRIIKEVFIFENDILKDFMGNIYLVVYRPDLCAFVLKDKQGYQGLFCNKPDNGYDFEYVGNIFDTPHLLEN